MGLCDVIPGISGGTIAFITGIYGRLMKAVANIDKVFLKYLFSGNMQKAFKRIDFTFLITLFGGIILAVLIGSRAIIYLLDNYFIYTISFFIGIILGSLELLTENISIKKYSLFGILGLLLGISFMFVIPLTINPSLIYIFFGGFLAISAMFLPGISGAFILLVMGLYGVMLRAIKIMDITKIIIFVVGAFLGALTISRIINFLFKKYKNKTMIFLAGLVLGSLSVPFKSIVYIQELSFFKTIIMFLFLVLGLVIVFLLNKLKK